MNIPLSTLDAALAEWKTTTDGNNTVSAAQQNQLKFYLRVASDRFRKRVGFDFLPRIETLPDILLTSEDVNSGLNTFYFRKPLLALTSVIVGSTTLTAPTQVTTYPANNVEPITHLRLPGNGAYRSWYGFTDNECDPLTVSITGVWGYRTRYATEAWVKYDDVTTAGISDSATSVTVANADGLDPYGITPRFSPGQFIRIGTEYMEVTAVNPTTNVLTIRRGVHGSTAAAHLVGDDIDSWQVEEDVRRVIERQAALMSARRGAFQVSEITDVGTIQYPADLLAELHAVADQYMYV